MTVISHVYTYAGIMIAYKIQIYSFKDICTLCITLTFRGPRINIMAKVTNYKGEVCTNYLTESILRE